MVPLFLKIKNLGLERKLTLISAPAGYGKTTLFCDWIQQYKLPVAWYSLDKRDNDPVEFLNYFIAAIQTIQRGFAKVLFKFLTRQNGLIQKGY